MSYEAYDEYKDSKLTWLGNIPNDWEIERLGYHSTIITGHPFNSDLFSTEGLPLIRIRDLKEEDTTLFWNNDYPNYAIINNGDLLVGMDGDFDVVSWKGKKALLNQRIFKINAKNKLLDNYLKYLLQIPITHINELTMSTTVKHLSVKDVNDIKTPLPPKNEQKQIANYLDKQTAKIDETISKNKQLIELLEEKRTALINQVVTKGLNPEVPMKDSGIEWIGEIPEHWGVEKLKNISQVKPSNVDKKSKDNEPPVLLCNYTDVYNNGFITMDLDFMKATASYDQIKKLSLSVGDIIITKDSETADDIAVPAIVSEELDNVVCGYHLAVIRPNVSKIYPKFLFRSFESDKINKQFEIGANGVTRFGLGAYPINNAYVCQPPLNEQKEIADYLDKETSKIFKAKDKIMEHIELLDEYKTSLIHHVVTGKIDVRGEEI